MSDEQISNEIFAISNAIKENVKFLRTQDRKDVFNAVTRALIFASICTKHPGFKEEMEWRVTYCPSFEPTDSLIKEFEIIKAVPQIVYKIPLEDRPEEGLTGLSIPSLINRIIIGPTQYPLAMHKAFVLLLAELGVEDAHKKVHISGIPLR
jgi:hypothetical protein